MKSTRIIVPSIVISSIALLIVFMMVSGCNRSEKLYYTAPTPLPNTDRIMKTAGFWISRHPFPDRLMLSPGEVATFNSYTQNVLKLIKDVTTIPSCYEREASTASLKEKLDSCRSAGLYVKDGTRVSALFFNAIEANMNLEKLPSAAAIRFALISSYADQRVLPTAEGLYAEPGDFAFDELQNSALDIGTPVAVIHQTADKKWCYLEDPLNKGWVETDRLAFCSLDELRDFLNAEKFIVVTKAKGEIFFDDNLTEYCEFARMGVKLPLSAPAQGKIFPVALPRRDEDGSLILIPAFMETKQVQEGFLPFTARNIIQQAFELINEPYGWGGMFGEQDCSRFIQEVFATVGISMPRNSSKQSLVGLLLDKYPDGADDRQAKNEFIARNAVGGLTLLYLRGHIMLFLGIYNNMPYAIHDIWGYRQPTWHGDRVRVINRVAVTDLSLGEGSKKGSLIERLNSVRMITKYAEPFLLSRAIPRPKLQ